MRRALGSLTVLGCLVLAPRAAHANFHLWEINEVYSNADGSIQYIELTVSADGQQFLNGSTITANDGSPVTFTFPGNSPAGTAGKTLLIANDAYNAECTGAPRDFDLPDNFFNPGASTITITFSGGDSLTISTTPVPTDGTHALDGSGAVVLSSPKNFAGAFECLAVASCDDCSDGAFCNGAEACTTTGCVAPDVTPCDAPADMCNEGTDTCFQCDGPEDCDDGNGCTDDTCNGSLLCVHTDNTAGCDDGLFCTSIDACSGGTCVGGGDACPGENCLEGSDACGDCDDPTDCDDGVFCNGAETCTAMACGAATAGPCDPVTTTCDEAGDACLFICGNGALDGDEACDDGNATDDDGCTACAVDDGFTCDAGEPSVCTPIPEVDAMPAPDAEPGAPDAGVEPPGDDDGCCSTGRRGPGGGTLLLLAIVALSSRRGSRRSA